MLLVKTANGQVEQFPYTLGDLRRENPNTSFPKKIGDAILADHGIFHVMPNAQPDYDNLVQTVVRDPEPNNNETSVNSETGETYNTRRWVIGYTVANKPQDQAQSAIRSKRDRLLADTDWMALSDSPAMNTEWATYRQGLRDVTAQTGFPYDVNWPNGPAKQ
jgi:hypothetical protein